MAANFWIPSQHYSLVSPSLSPQRHYLFTIHKNNEKKSHKTQLLKQHKKSVKLPHEILWLSLLLHTKLRVYPITSLFILLSSCSRINSSVSELLKAILSPSSYFKKGEWWSWRSRKSRRVKRIFNYPSLIWCIRSPPPPRLFRLSFFFYFDKALWLKWYYNPDELSPSKSKSKLVRVSFEYRKRDSRYFRIFHENLLLLFPTPCTLECV